MVPDQAVREQMSTRAGRYVRQPAGYRAFIPSRLPPVPPLELGAMLALLSKADRALARLDGSVHNLPDPDLFVFMYVRKEAVLSSQIEGTQSSLNDVLEAEARMFDREQKKDVGEVLNYIGAMNDGLKRLENLALVLPPHPGNPCLTDARRAWRREAAWRNPYFPELDRPGRHPSGRGPIRSASASCCHGCAQRP
jgi:Fic/DOC family N-terminal